MNNLTPSQQSQLLSQIDSIPKLKSISNIQQIISDHCFSPCIKKIQSRSDELHGGEVQCIQRCLWRYMQVHGKVAEYYAREHPLKDFQRDIDAMEHEMQNMGENSEMGASEEQRMLESASYWRDLARRGEMENAERIRKAREEAEAHERRLREEREREQQANEEGNVDEAPRSDPEGSTIGFQQQNAFLGQQESTSSSNGTTDSDSSVSDRL